MSFRVLRTLIPALLAMVALAALLLLVDQEDTARGAADPPPAANAAVAASTQIFGDVDCDGVVGSVDALFILRYVAALLPLAQCLNVSDVNCNGNTDSVDALSVLRYVAALPVFPAVPTCPAVGSPAGTTPTPTVALTSTPTATPTPTLPPVTVQQGWFIEAGDGQFLGVFTCNQFDSDGIFNKFGQYGSQFSSTSIWNAFGQYGGQFGSYSPFNWYADHPIITDGTVFLYLRTIYYPRVTPTDLAIACFSNDPSELAYWLDLIP